MGLICAILLLVAEFIGFIETAGYIAGAVEDNSIEQPIIPKELYPDVDIFIATYNEETELLRKTVNGCKNMEYPDKNKVHIYICDDHVGAKAGNLNNALRHTTSPYVATFDADMIPMHDFLLTVMPYFFLDRYEKDATGAWVERKEAGKNIGFVQTPQSFYNADLFQYNLFSENIVPNEQNFFFQFIQSGRNKANAAIYPGSNTVLSREALNSVGGFYEKAITEDLATGLLIQTNGYASFALDEVHASGLAPTDIKSLFKQRDRWARGCIQTFRQLHLFTRKGMEGKQRRAYISSLLYWYTPIRRAIFIVAPILYSVFHIFLLDINSDPNYINVAKDSYVRIAMNSFEVTDLVDTTLTKSLVTADVNMKNWSATEGQYTLKTSGNTLKVTRSAKQTGKMAYLETELPYAITRPQAVDFVADYTNGYRLAITITVVVSLLLLFGVVAVTTLLNKKEERY